MKTFIAYCLWFFIATWFGNAIAEQASKIELIDGGVIFGRIVSQQDGRYVIQTNTLGTVSIDEEKIRVIRINHGPSPENASAPPPAQSSSEEIQDLRKSIMGNEAIMQKVLSLQNDPRMQEILQDPEILKAINSGNFAALLSNQKFLELLNSDEIKEIEKEIAAPAAGGK